MNFRKLAIKTTVWVQIYGELKVVRESELRCLGKLPTKEATARITHASSLIVVFEKCLSARKVRNGRADARGGIASPKRKSVVLRKLAVRTGSP